MEQRCEVHRLGLVDYQKAWQLQDRLALQIARNERAPTLLLLEHPHTYTFGRRGHPENLLWSNEQLKQRQVCIYWVDRGGDVTYHGPGQLVGYPLLPLAPGGLKTQPGQPTTSLHLPQPDYVGYLRKLEATLVLALRRLGVSSGKVKGLTGVWVQPKTLRQGDLENSQKPAKIAAIGVKVDVKGVTHHGFALNVSPDMSFWEGIIGCGIREYPIISLAQLLDPPPTLDFVMDCVVAAFGEVFGYRMLEISSGLENAT